MKNIFILLTIVLVGSSFSPSSEMKWYSFEEGYKLAKKQNKIMLVDVYTDWCGWCKRMDRDTYAKSEIMTLIEKDFIAIKFNPEVSQEYMFEGKKYNGSELASVLSKNQLSGYPTTIFYQPNSKKTNVLGGYYDANRFKGVLENISKEMVSKK